jgi:hypothetical protein
VLNTIGGPLLCCLVLLANGCNSKPPAAQDSTETSARQMASASPSNSAEAKSDVRSRAATVPASGKGFIDACALIEKSEISSVQGFQVQSTVPSTHTTGDLVISQCYYTVTSADGSKNLSVHVEVMQADPKSSKPYAVKNYWEETFGEGGKSRGGEREEEERSTPPQRIAGVGEEAFWIGNKMGGAVYALKRDKLVRVSVGGPDDQKTKIEKSKRFVTDVFKRLS